MSAMDWFLDRLIRWSERMSGRGRALLLVNDSTDFDIAMVAHAARDAEYRYRIALSEGHSPSIEIWASRVEETGRALKAAQRDCIRRIYDGTLDVVEGETEALEDLIRAIRHHRALGCSELTDDWDDLIGALVQYHHARDGYAIMGAEARPALEAATWELERCRQQAESAFAMS